MPIVRRQDSTELAAFALGLVFGFVAGLGANAKIAEALGDSWPEPDVRTYGGNGVPTVEIYKVNPSQVWYRCTSGEHGLAPAGGRIPCR